MVTKKRPLGDDAKDSLSFSMAWAKQQKQQSSWHVSFCGQNVAATLLLSGLKATAVRQMSGNKDARAFPFHVRQLIVGPWWNPAAGGQTQTSRWRSLWMLSGCQAVRDRQESAGRPQDDRCW